SYVSDEINKRMARPYECIKAMKLAKSAIPRDGAEVDIEAVYAMISVLVDSTECALNDSTDDLIKFMSSWED
ncbi:MAG: hypothetical protein WAW41_04710, partial [Methylobacter sp.]